MKVDASIVTDYLQGNERYARHWLFASIREGEYTFAQPDPACRDAVEALCSQAEAILRPIMRRCSRPCFPAGGSRPQR